MVWEGEGVIKYGRKLIGATNLQKSEPGTIRGDLAIVVGRGLKDLRCIVFVEKVITAIVLCHLLNVVLPSLSGWKTEYAAGSNTRLQLQSRKAQNKFVVILLLFLESCSWSFFLSQWLNFG